MVTMSLLPHVGSLVRIFPVFVFGQGQENAGNVIPSTRVHSSVAKVWVKQSERIELYKPTKDCAKTTPK